MALNQEIQQAYTIIIGKCTPVIIDKLEVLKIFETVKSDQDAIELLKLTNNLNLKFED